VKFPIPSRLVRIMNCHLTHVMPLTCCSSTALYSIFIVLEPNLLIDKSTGGRGSLDSYDRCLLSTGLTQARAQSLGGYCTCLAHSKLRRVLQRAVRSVRIIPDPAARAQDSAMWPSLELAHATACVLYCVEHKTCFRDASVTLSLSIPSVPCLRAH
jgi:hypothetical protein